MKNRMIFRIIASGLLAMGPVEAATARPFVLLDRLTLTTWPLANEYHDPDDPDISDHALLANGNLVSGDLVRGDELVIEGEKVEAALFLEHLAREQPDGRIRILPEGDVRFADFLDFYKSLQSMVGPKLGLGGNIRFARFSITDEPLISGNDIYDIGALSGPEMFVFIDSIDSRNDRAQCDIHFGENRTDTVQLLHFTRDYRKRREEKLGRPVKSLNLFITPGTPYECFGGVVITLNFAGYTDFDIRMIERQGV